MESTARDHTFQIKLETVASTKLIELFVLTAGVVAEPASGAVIFVKFDLKNTTVV